MKRYFIAFSFFTCLFLTACGGSITSSSAISSQATQSAIVSSGTPSPSSGAPTVLHVTRTDPSVTNNIGSLDKTVTDSSAVQNLYTMAHSLPPYSTGTSISQNCLNDLGVIYHLTFLQGTSEVQRMNLDPGNCKILYLSQSDLRQASDPFLNLLKEALHLNSLTSN